MKKNIFIVIIIVVIISIFSIAIARQDKEKELTEDDFIQCLADAGVVIYGTKTCSVCISLVDSFGGYKALEPIYVDCGERRDRCGFEMQTNYVPEIQIKGDLYSGSMSLDNIAKAAGCEI